MDLANDIREYLPDPAAKMVYIRRLLMWLKPFQGDGMEEEPDIDDKTMQLLLRKGLVGLSEQEAEHLLTHLDMAYFVPKFKEMNITGKDLQGMSLEDVQEISPNRTRAECKLLVRQIKQIQAISQNASNTGSLLRQLNAWFSGEFRSITDPPLYARDDTTVVQATHKASGQVAVKVVLTADPERYKRAKREMNFFKMFHGQKYICNMLNSTCMDAANGIPSRCACVFPLYELGTVQDLLKRGKPEFTHRPPSAVHACLLLEHVVDMAKDVLAGLESMHQKKIVHRDIKPGNICVELLPSKGKPRLRYVIIDLGAAVSMKVQPSESKSKSGLSRRWSAVGFTGQYTSLPGLKLPLGTVPFMSPEHIDEDSTVDARSDVFSFGVTLYLCLCSRFPFVQPYEADDDQRLAVKLMVAYESDKEASPLEVLDEKANGRAVEELVEVVTKSIRKLAEERYQSASEMQAEIKRIDRFTELTHSLELYGLDPNTKLHLARAQRSESERNFASSNYKSIVVEVRAKQARISTWSVVRAVEELIKIHAHDNWAASFVKELEQCKKHKSFAKDVGSTAQYLWTSAQRHGTTELCSILNRAIREDDPNATIHAVVFANAINMLLVEDRGVQPWLQKVFKQSYPYPGLLGKGIQRLVLKLKNPLPHSARYCCTWRGGGFRDVYRNFFELDKWYRIPGFLATSLDLNTALKFLRRRKKGPRILWCILLDHRGQTKSEFRCKHAKFVLKTEVAGEMEFLFAPYSVFKVVRADFSPRDWSDRKAHYTVLIEAAIDNSVHKEDMELAPWQ